MDHRTGRVRQEFWIPGSLHEALDVLDHGIDLKRYTSELDQVARHEKNCETGAKAGTVTVSFRMEPDAAEVWKACVERCRALEGPDLAEWVCADRFLDAFFAQYDRLDPLRYALNHKVFERDGCPSTSSGTSCCAPHPAARGAASSTVTILT